MKLGQPDLFTKRVRKLPPAPEFAVHAMVVDLLRLCGKKDWIWFHPANGERRDKSSAGRLKRMGVRPGVSDLILIAPPDGRVHALELKKLGETPDDNQRAFLAALVAAGGQAAWADTFTDAVEILKAWGAVKVTP